MKYSPEIAAKIVVNAAKFKGLTEIKSNAAWDNLSTVGKDAIADELVNEMLRTGWEKTWPYCAAFCEMVWRRAYTGRPELPDVKTMLTPGCLLSFNNAADKGWTSQVPQIGAIGIMKKGSTSQGHAFIVTSVKNGVCATIEANTSPAAGTPEADREGDGVYAKKRSVIYKPTTGLHLVGFILPMIYS